MSLEHPCLDFARDDPWVRMYGLGAAARRYQMMGYRVLALGEGSKRPNRLFAPPPGYPPGTAGVHWATRDHRMVEYVWGRDKLAGVGVATGSGLMVIDLDVKHGDDGPANFTSYFATAPWPIPQNVVTSTPSGGLHIWLRTLPGEKIPSRPGILPGVDVKVDDGYVVAVPSRVWTDSAAGSVLLPYRQVSGCPCDLPWAPEWLVQWVRSAEATGTDHGGNGAPMPGLEQLKQTGLERGNRNVGLYRLACSLFRRCGTSPGGIASARAEIAMVLSATDTAGFTHHEIERTIGYALAFVQRSESDRDEKERLLATWPTWQAAS